MMVQTPHIAPQVSQAPQLVPVARPAPEGIGLGLTTFVPVSQNSLGLQMFATELLVIPSGTAIPGDRAPKLNCDVFASKYWTNDGVIIRAELVDEEGYGRTYDEAWTDFLTSLRDRYVSLARREERLSPEDRRALNALRTVINFDL